MAVCAAVADVLSGSHPTLNALFEASGAPGPPPDLPHDSKWKTWLFRAGNDPEVDSLALLGILVEEFMDLPPLSSNSTSDNPFGFTGDPVADYNQKRQRLNSVFEEHGFRYFRDGRILPIDQGPPVVPSSGRHNSGAATEPRKPSNVEELLEVLVRGLPRAMHPLIHRRKGLHSLTFGSEYDIQDLLHAQLRAWIADIRPEEFTPSHAGSSTRMDFLLPAHRLVLETKRIRDTRHAAEIGGELIIDIEHYQGHPDCDHLWCVVYDPSQFIQNPSGLVSDLEGSRSRSDGSVDVRMFIFSG